MRYTVAALEAMPTLSVSQAYDLKIDDGRTRVWLARCGIDDGAAYDNGVTVEKLRAGRWVTVEQYEGL